MNSSAAVAFFVLFLVFAAAVTLLVESYKDDPVKFKKNVQLVSWILVGMTVFITLLLIKLNVHKG